MAAQAARRTESPVVEESSRPIGIVKERDLPARSRQAFQVLHLGYAALPIIAGADKFFQLLVDWDLYLAPQISRALGVSAHTFMQGAGVVEIAAGVGVAVKPRIFGYVVSAWLGGIIVNLLMTGQYRDIALRDFGLALGALALARLSPSFERRRV